MQEPQTKLKKSKKLKYKKNEHVAKLTEISTNSESEERLLSTGSQVNAPIEVPKVVAKQSGEKPKKRNKGAKKNADMLVSKSPTSKILQTYSAQITLFKSYLNIKFVSYTFKYFR